MEQKSCFRVAVRLIYKKEIRRAGLPCIEENYNINIVRKKDSKKYIWIVLVEKYMAFRVLIISFHLKKYDKAKGIKKYKRHFKGESENIESSFVLRLFAECYKLCNQQENKGYAFGFYAVDDEYIEEGKREDMNRRMSVFTKYLQRDGFHLKARDGNIRDSIYLATDSNYEFDEEKLNQFITYYKPILEEEIYRLYNHQDTAKL